MEIDLTKSSSCSDNPVSRLIGIMNENVEEFVVIARKDVIPLDFAKLIADKKGYQVELIESQDNVFKLKFVKREQQRG
ncbi:MAG: hypothetical protein QXP68_02120 [Thermosphaera sp.]